MGFCFGSHNDQGALHVHNNGGCLISSQSPWLNESQTLSWETKTQNQIYAGNFCNPTTEWGRLSNSRILLCSWNRYLPFMDRIPLILIVSLFVPEFCSLTDLFQFWASLRLCVMLESFLSTLRRFNPVVCIWACVLYLSGVRVRFNVKNNQTGLALSFALFHWWTDLSFQLPCYVVMLKIWSATTLLKLKPEGELWLD